MNNWFKGLHYIFDGYQLILRPELRHLMIIPVLINTLFYITLFFVFQHFYHGLNQWMAAYVPSWLWWLGTVVWLLCLVGFAFILAYTFLGMANLFAAPFNSYLAQKVEYVLHGAIMPSRSATTISLDILKSIGRQFRLLAYYLPWALALWLLAMIPIMQAAVVLVSLFFQSWFLALTYLDYPTENQGITIQATRAWLRERRGLAWGLGMGILIAMVLPILNLFAMPAAVAAATKMWVDHR